MAARSAHKTRREGQGVVRLRRPSTPRKVVFPGAASVTSIQNPSARIPVSNAHVKKMEGGQREAHR